VAASNIYSSLDVDALLGRVAVDAGAAWDFPSLLPLAQERGGESRLVPTEDRARLLPNTLLALGSSVLFKDKAPCGCTSIGLGA
jgi:hypothetical protein